MNYFYLSLLKNNLETFSESECLSRQNLAQSILAKERESELKKEYEVNIYFIIFISNKIYFQRFFE